MADAVGRAVSGLRSSRNLGRVLQVHTNTHTRARSNSHSKPARWGIGASKFRTYTKIRGYRLAEEDTNWHLLLRFRDLDLVRPNIGEFLERSLLRVFH